jgi:hypothetical protein
VATLPRLAFRAWADKNDVSRSEAVRRLLEAGLKAKGKRGEVITGAQIRQARRLLNWRISELATRARVPASLIERAERADGVALITLAHEAALRLALNPPASSSQAGMRRA